MNEDPQTGEHWRVCASLNPTLGAVLEVEGRSNDIDLVNGEDMYRLYLTSNHNHGTTTVPRSWLRERIES